MDKREPDMVMVPRDQLETLKRSIALGSLLPGEGEALIECWVRAAPSEGGDEPSSPGPPVDREAGVVVPRDKHGRDAHQIIADSNREAMFLRAGAKDRSREPLLGPPNDMAVSRVLLAERPDFDPEEADRIAVKINDTLAAAPPPSVGEGVRERVARIIDPRCADTLDRMLADADTPEKRAYILRNWFGPDVFAKADAILAALRPDAGGA